MVCSCIFDLQAGIEGFCHIAGGRVCEVQRFDVSCFHKQKFDVTTG